MAGRLWPEVPEQHVRGSLRSALWRLQKAVPGLVEVSGSEPCVARGVDVDVDEFSRWARDALDPRTRTEDVWVPEAALDGDLLPRWYDDWILLERERLCASSAARARGGRRQARLAIAGRHGDALPTAYAAIREEPLRESAHCTVVLVHLAEGNVGESVRANGVLAELLRDELGVRPTPHVTRLVQGLLRLAAQYRLL